jgi:hypothetical protein
MKKLALKKNIIVGKKQNGGRSFGMISIPKTGALVGRKYRFIDFKRSENGASSMIIINIYTEIPHLKKYKKIKEADWSSYLKYLPLGTKINNIESIPGLGSKYLPLGIKINNIESISGLGLGSKYIRSAGTIRPSVMNPVDHPMGGRTKGGCVPRSKTGKLSHLKNTKYNCIFAKLSKVNIIGKLSKLNIIGKLSHLYIITKLSKNIIAKLSHFNTTIYSIFDKLSKLDIISNCGKGLDIISYCGKGLERNRKSNNQKIMPFLRSNQNLSKSQFSLLLFGNNLFINNLFYISLGLGIGILLSYLTSWLAKEIKKNSSNNQITTPPSETFSEPTENPENIENKFSLENLPNNDLHEMSENEVLAPFRGKPFKFNLKAFLDYEDVSLDVKINFVKYILDTFIKSENLDEFLPMLEDWCFSILAEGNLSEELFDLLIDCKCTFITLKLHYKYKEKENANNNNKYTNIKKT